MKIHWTALTREGQRHLLMLVLVFSSGLGLVAWCWPLDREALQVLRFTKKRAARDIEKVLRSAIANAERKAGEDERSGFH